MRALSSRPAYRSTAGSRSRRPPVSLRAVSRFRAIFPSVKHPLIAMAHLPPLPGTPLYNAAAGVQGIVDAVRRDLEHLVPAGFDAIMFCNEGDRPYQLTTDQTTAAAMSRVVAECRPLLTGPFGVDGVHGGLCAVPRVGRRAASDPARACRAEPAMKARPLANCEFSPVLIRSRP